MYRVVLSLILILFLVGDKQAQTKPYTVTFFDHPQLPYFKVLIEKSYSDIGIKVVFRKMPPSRSLNMVSRGEFDAEVARLQEIITMYDNLVMVPHVLAEANYYLLCAKDTECSPEIITDDLIDLAVHQQTTDSLKRFFPGLNANIVEVSSPVYAMNLLNAGRVKYALIPLVPDVSNELTKNLEMVHMKTAFIYHVVHKRNEYLVPSLIKSIEINQELIDKTTF